MKNLSREEIDSVLVRVGYGFLGLASENRPYVVPMSFGYDGDNCYFQMNSQGRKFDYIEDEAPASLTVLTIDHETGVSKSILVEGRIYEVSADKSESAWQALALNAQFGTDLSLWGMSLQESDISLYVLRPENVSGRVFGEQHV